MIEESNPGLDSEVATSTLARDDDSTQVRVKSRERLLYRLIEFGADPLPQVSDIIEDVFCGRFRYETVIRIYDNGVVLECDIQYPARPPWKVISLTSDLRKVDFVSAWQIRRLIIRYNRTNQPP